MNGYPNGYGGNGQYGYPAPSPHDLASGSTRSRSMTDGSTRSRSTRSSNMRRRSIRITDTGRTGFWAITASPARSAPCRGTMPRRTANRRATAGTATSATTVPIARRSPKRRAPIRGETSSFEYSRAGLYQEPHLQPGFLFQFARAAQQRRARRFARPQARLYHPRDL